MAEPKIKYDRQLRIWGEQGQVALEKSSICLLNCGPTGSETLKNLFLGGVGSITVVDGSKVELGDLGNNFMVDELSVGKSKAQTLCAFLQELNDAVKAQFIEEYPEALIDSNPLFFSQFTLVIATQLVEDSMVKLDRICRNANVMLIFARSYGLSGFVRISVKDLIKSKMIATDEDNYKEAIEASFKVFAPQGISSSVQQIINDSCADVNSNSSDFWVLVAALKEFIANEGGGEAPLEGSIPDMTSSTELYINLQRIYQAKAEADFLIMEQLVRKILKKIGRDTDSVSKATIKCFCKNARKLKVCRYRPIEDEFNSPVQVELQKYLTDEDYSIAVGFYILLRVVDRFAANNNSFPGAI